MAVNELLGQLHEVAASPKKQLDKYLAEGRKVVAVAPVYTPQEIIHSMGLVPMGVWGADMEINEAKKYYPAFICSIMQTILELGIKGEYEGVSAIVIPSLCDSLKSLGQNWKYAVKGIPFIPMTYPQNRKPAYGVKFTKACYERVINDLTVATGAQYSAFALAESNKIYNEHNAVMREFAEIASWAPITAAQRNDVFKSAWFMLPEEHTAIVKQINDELKACPKDENKVRVHRIFSRSLTTTASRLPLTTWPMSPGSTARMCRIWPIRWMPWPRSSLIWTTAPSFMIRIRSVWIISLSRLRSMRQRA